LYSIKTLGKYYHESLFFKKKHNGGRKRFNNIIISKSGKYPPDRSRRSRDRPADQGAVIKSLHFHQGIALAGRMSVHSSCRDGIFPVLSEEPSLSTNNFKRECDEQ
jgi:hypothetical protein